MPQPDPAAQPGARLVLEAEVVHGALRLRDGRIAEIAAARERRLAVETDARLLPASSLRPLALFRGLAIGGADPLQQEDRGAQLRHAREPRLEVGDAVAVDIGLQQLSGESQFAPAAAEGLRADEDKLLAAGSGLVGVNLRQAMRSSQRRKSVITSRREFGRESTRWLVNGKGLLL